MNIKPMNDHVVIIPDEDTNISAGGIVIATTEKATPVKGEVIAVGPGKLNSKGIRKPLGIEPGDKIIFVKGTGNEIELEGTKYVFLLAEHIIALEKGV